jgi:ferrochelatase
MAENVRDRVGVVLVNTGTPASTSVADVRRYLGQFLNDPRVIDIPAWQRWLLLNFIILRFRPAKSAAAYRKIWTDRGSPLLFHGLDLAAGMQTELGDGALVKLAFQFGEPSIPQAFQDFADAGIQKVCVLPLFPQYASASTGSAVQAAIEAAAERWVIPSLHVVPPFWAEPEFLDGMATHLQDAIAHDEPDHVLLSFHGVPEHHCTQTDATGQHCLKKPDCCDTIGPVNAACYRAQCFATARSIMARLNLDAAHTTVAFQSRLGRVPWIRPYTDEKITELAKAGTRKIVVAEPAFVADCLETLEEIGIRGREDFKAAGGEDLSLVRSLNADPAWAVGLANIARRSCSWLA